MHYLLVLLFALCSLWFVFLSETPGQPDVKSVVLKGNCFESRCMWRLICHHMVSARSAATTITLDHMQSHHSDYMDVVMWRTGKSHTERVEVHSPAKLALECTWADDQNGIIPGFWRKDGLEIENSRVTLQPENEQYNLKRTQVHHVSIETWAP